MGIGNNLTLCSLSEYLLQFNNRKTFRVDNILKNISGSHTWQLVHIPHKNQPCSHRYRFKKRIHNCNIHHRHLIHNNYVSLQWILFISVKMNCCVTTVPRPTAYLKKPVDSLCLKACSFAHSLCSSSRWCRKPYVQPLHLEKPDNCIYSCGFTCSRASGNNYQTIKNGSRFSFSLDIVQPYLQLIFNSADSSVHLYFITGIFYIQVCKHSCHICLHVIIHGCIYTLPAFNFPDHNLLIYRQIHYIFVKILYIN